MSHALEKAHSDGISLHEVVIPEGPLGSLKGCDLQGVDLKDAALYWVNLSNADLRGAILPDGVPVVPNIDRAIRDAIKAGGALCMGQWHGDEFDNEEEMTIAQGYCGTTHCRAGWAVALAGEPGVKLEERIGTGAAGALIYAASRPDRAVPNFYADDYCAMADIEACAAEQS